MNLSSGEEIEYPLFLKLLKRFCKQLRRPYFYREEILSYIIYTGYNMSYYKLCKLLKKAVREGYLREDKKKDVRKSYEWGLPIYRRVYVLKKLP